MAVAKVGVSSRTPIKHYLLDKILGRVVGVLSLNNPRVPAKLPLIVFDMCAGDGQRSEESGVSSPEIIRKHINYPRLAGKASALFFERNANTFDVLSSGYANEPSIKLFNRDSSNINLYDYIVHPEQALFFHFDPNSIAQWPVNPSFLKSLPATSTFFATLGCNPSGVKRLPFETRVKWFEIIQGMAAGLPKWHDLILAWLERDSHQWAYVIRTPIVWANEDLQLIRKMSEKNEFGFRIGGVSLRQNQAEFAERLDILFLTKEERNVAA